MHLEIKAIAIRDHYTTIAAMMRGLHESEKELFNKTDDWDAIEQSYMKHIIEQQEEAAGTCLITLADGVPAGFIFGYEEEEGESRIEAYDGKDLYISDGYVYPQFRRLGIYKKMNGAIEEWYIALGIRRILRFTLASNTRMQQFLGKEQYQPVRVLYEKWLTPDGTEVDPLKLTPPESL